MGPLRPSKRQREHGLAALLVPQCRDHGRWQRGRSSVARDARSRWSWPREHGPKASGAEAPPGCAMSAAYTAAASGSVAEVPLRAGRSRRRARVAADGDGMVTGDAAQRALLTRPPQAAAAQEPPLWPGRASRRAPPPTAAAARPMGAAPRALPARRLQAAAAREPPRVARASKEAVAAGEGSSTARASSAANAADATAASGSRPPPWPGRAGRPIAAARPRVERGERRPCGSRRWQRHRSPPRGRGEQGGTNRRQQQRHGQRAQRSEPPGRQPGRQPQAAATSPASWGEQAGLRRRRRRQGDRGSSAASAAVTAAARAAAVQSLPRWAREVACAPPRTAAHTWKRRDERRQAAAASGNGTAKEPCE